jgi:hypothetical protein
MYQHATMDKGPQNPKTTLPMGMYSDQDGNLRHLPAPEIWWRRDRSTGGIQKRARLQIEYAYYRFVNNIDFWCFNDILCSIVGDKLIVNV